MNESPDLKARILERIGTGAPQGVWTAADFLDLATRDTVDKALQRFVATGTLRRIDRGIYDKPDFKSITKAPNHPDPRQVDEAKARRGQIRILAVDKHAAKYLGLNTSVTDKLVDPHHSYRTTATKRHPALHLQT